MLRHTLLLGAALATVAGSASAQTRRPSREDLLDQLTRHIQICSEITDGQQRLACFDKMQNDVDDAQAPGPQPTPLAGNPPPPSSPSTSSGGGFGATPLAPPPLMTPGGGVATLGGRPGQSTMPPPPPPSSDPDAAFDPNRPSSSPSDATAPKPQPPIRRTGPRPLPYSPTPLPLVTLTASNLTYGNARYWQVSVTVTSNTSNTVDTQIQCTFRNAGRSVGEAYLGPLALAPGEQIATEMIGPPTSTYVDSTNCRVLSP
jgi:hypothetical protein